jgi:hypothetical protein
MKPTKILMGALAAGLMAFAIDKAQAVVIANELYTPLNIKLSVSYWDAKGNIKQARVTSKEVLKQVGAPKGTLLAVDFNAPYDVFLINGKTLGTDLTTAGYVTMYASDTLNNQIDGKNGSYKYSEAGILELDVYSDPVFTGEIPVLDKGLSEEASSEWFEISGFYNYNETGSAIDKSGYRKYSVNYKAKALSGLGADSTSPKDVPDPTVLTGSVSGRASGKILPST